MSDMDGGKASALNYGIARARHEIVIGLDSTLASGQVNAVKFVHVKDDGSVELIKNLCNVTTGGAPTNMPCRYFTPDGGDTLAHIWITGNGRLSGY